MKIILFFIINFSICYSQTIWYAHATEGNDANDGTSWAQAELTLSAAVAHLTTNDTLLLRGDFGTEIINITTGEGSAIMDSMFYERSWSVNRATGLKATTDSTILDWGTEIDRAQVQFQFPDYKFYGIYFDNQSGNATVGDIDANDVQFWFCRFNNSSLGVQVQEVADRSRVMFKYCLFLDTNSGTFIQWANNTIDPTVEHCTFVSTNTSKFMNILTSGVSNDSSGTFKNNIVYFTGNYNDNVSMLDHDEPNKLFNDWNYNIYWITDVGFPTQGGFQWNAINPPINFVAWKDSLQNGVKGIDSDGESNSQFADPAITVGSNYGLISRGSIAIRAASDGTEIGFWQFGKRFNVRRRGIKR